MSWNFSFAGPKAAALQAVQQQVSDEAGRAILEAIINASGTDNVSLGGSANPTSIALSGSFFNDQKPVA